MQRIGYGCMYKSVEYLTKLVHRHMRKEITLIIVPCKIILSIHLLYITSIVVIEYIIPSFFNTVISNFFH